MTSATSLRLTRLTSETLMRTSMAKTPTLTLTMTTTQRSQSPEAPVCWEINNTPSGTLHTPWQSNSNRRRSCGKLQMQWEVRRQHRPDPHPTQSGDQLRNLRMGMTRRQRARPGNP